MNDERSYVLGQTEAAARRLEVQDAHFAEASERQLDELALRPGDRVVELGVALQDRNTAEGRLRER